MNNEETMIMQPKQENAADVKNTNNTEDVKTTDKGSTAKRVAATTAAGVFGGAMGGAGSVVAAQMINNAEEEVAEEEEVEVQEEPKPTPAAEEHAEEIPVTVEEQEHDYTGHDGADPVVEEPHAIPAGNETESEAQVQVLGVYENEEGQELAILTNGEEYAAVLDGDGDGIADLLGVDENGNGQLEEGEIYDISEQHVEMSMYEDAYLAQQQEMEVEQNETFAYNADEQNDYNNDADIYYEA